MLEKAFDSLSADDICRLIDARAEESLTLEFKAQLPGNKDNERREFLKDVTAFANAFGGDLLYGIEEAEGAAARAPGLTVSDRDAEERRYHDILSSAIEPRLANVRMRWIELPDGASIFHVRVPASLASPHRVTLSGHGHFYQRHARGNYQMDVHQLRAAFNSSDALPKRLQALHELAVFMARGVDMPVMLGPGPSLTASFIPLSIFRDPRELDVGWSSYVRPPKGSGINLVPTIEGALTYPSTALIGTDSMSFCLTHRSGRVDAAWRLSAGAFQGVENLLGAEEIETSIEQWVFASKKLLAENGAEAPYALFLTLQNIRGASLYPGMSGPAWQDNITLPHIRIDQLTPASLLPAYQSVWRCFGSERPETVSWFRESREA